MLISEFKIQNFKSYRETERIALTSGINIVTGQNNAGKTALLEAISMSNPKHVPHRSIRAIPSVSVDADPDSHVLLTVTLTNAEFLHALRGSSVQIPLPLVGQPFGDGLALRNHSEPELEKFRKWFFSRDSYTLDLPFQRKSGQNFHIRVSLFSLSRMYSIAENAACAFCSIKEKGPVFNPQIGGWSGGHDVATPVAPSVTRSMYRFTAERFNLGSYRFGDEEALLPNASNLAEVLGVLRTNDGAFDRYNEAVRRVLPQIWRVNVQPQGGNQRILIWGREAHEKERADLAFSLDESGTGIGQVLAILYVVVSAQTPKIILIDEPQSFLHPGAARKLIEVLKQYPQHQYIIATHSPTIITSAEPKTIILVKNDGSESQLQYLDSRVTENLRKYLDEIGASLADVFGADGIVWVEGITEEKCYPLIAERLLHRSLMGVVFKAVVATGDFDGKHAERFLEIYSRLSSGQSLIPPTVAFIFDDDARSDEEKRILKHRAQNVANHEKKERFHFTTRRMFENYLLNPRALEAVLNATDGHQHVCTAKEIEECIAACDGEAKMFGELPPEHPRDLVWIRADQVLKKVFSEVGGLEYRKALHSVEITRWLLDNSPGELKGDSNHAL